MTETKKIEKLLKLNDFASAIIVDKDAYVHEVNDFARKKFSSVKSGKSLYNLFDKNTALLVKNNLIDVKTFNKIQRRKVNVLTEDNNIFDDWLRRKVLSQGNSYVLKPMIAYQRDSFSDIWQTEARYKHYHTEGNKYLANL